MKIKKYLPILLILWVAFALRTYQLTDIPPGLTHDEANHGREAIGILDGIWLFYFPLNYGSEPLYSYTAAGMMQILGENLFSLRLVNVVLGLLTTAATYLWASRVFNRPTGLLTAALMAVSFWPLASSRQALRAGMLPFFMMGATWFLWQMIQTRQPSLRPTPPRAHTVRLIIAFALCTALTLHIYLAARVAWLVFPIFLLYLAWLHRSTFRQIWVPTLAGLVIAGLLVVPMFVYLANHPEAETRLVMFDNPLARLAAGEFSLVMGRAVEALAAFVVPGYGDHFLAYNIPGRPTFDGVTAVFFILGLLACGRHWKRPSYAFLLIWFLIGIAPSLLTGSTANTTRNLAALPAIMMLPAVGFVTLKESLHGRWPHLVRVTQPFVIGGWLVFAGWQAGYDYFFQWGTSAQVRGAYQHTLVAELAYLNQHQVAGPLVISTVYPGPAHDASISLVTAPYLEPDLRWVDARYALILPGGEAAPFVIPHSTPLHPAFTPLLQPTASVSLRADDLDPGFTLYDFDRSQWATWMAHAATPINFDNAVVLQQARWLQAISHPGETADLLTIWQVTDETRIGPLVPPANTTDMVLFTHVLDENGEILSQRDALDAPSWSWQTGDVIIQIHPLWLPPEMAAGVYETAVGLYDRRSGVRRPVVDADGTVIDSQAGVMPLTVVNP